MVFSPAAAAVLPVSSPPPASTPAVGSKGRAPELTDSVVEAARTGSRGAWDLIIARYNTLLVAVFIGYSITRHRAYELCQEVWLKLFLKARAGQLESLKVPGLPVRAARYRALDEVRGARPMESLDAEDAPEPFDLAPNAEELAARQRSVQLARRMLRALPPRQRQVMALAGVEGRPQAEVARELGISKQRVKQTLCEARSRMRAIRSMSAPIQAAYLAVVVDGRTAAEAAQTLRISTRTLAERLDAAKAHLRSRK